MGTIIQSEPVIEAPQHIAKLRMEGVRQLDIHEGKIAFPDLRGYDDPGIVRSNSEQPCVYHDEESEQLCRD